MKVLFFMPHAGATRNFESTLRGLAVRGHTVHLAFDRMFKKNLPGLWDLANSLTAEYPGITAGEHPQPLKTEPSFIAKRLRASLDYMRFFNSEFRNAPKLRRRAERWAPERVRQLAEDPLLPTAVMRAAFRSAERATPISESVMGYIAEQDPDAVLVTPLLEPGTGQVEFLRAANRMGIATCLCVHSWDNLTNKGLIHEVPDAITVWNEMQRDEAVELHHVPPERVVVTGASPYDHWFDWKPSRSREEFAASVGLDPERPFVAYLGSSGFIAPNEAAFIVEWMGELRTHGIGDIQVLARPHPVNPLVGAGDSQRELARLENVKLYPPAAANPTDEQSRNDYFDSLYYCHAATGINTTAFLEAAIIGRPVLTVRAPSVEETQDGMLHFHHLLNAGGGLLWAAETYEEHAADLNKALGAPHPEGCVSERSVKFTEAFIRPQGLDHPATPEMITTIEGLPERTNGKGFRVSLTGTILAGAAQRAATRAQRRARRAKVRRKRKAVRAANRARRQAEKGKAADRKQIAKERTAKAKAAERARGEKERHAKEKAEAAAAAEQARAEKELRAKEKAEAAAARLAKRRPATEPSPAKPPERSPSEAPSDAEDSTRPAAAGGPGEPHRDHEAKPSRVETP